MCSNSDKSFPCWVKNTNFWGCIKSPHIKKKESLDGPQFINCPNEKLIIGSLVFRTQDMPHYHPGLWACIASQLITLIIVALSTFKFMRDNKKVDRGEIHPHPNPLASLLYSRAYQTCTSTCYG